VVVSSSNLGGVAYSICGSSLKLRMIRNPIERQSRSAVSNRNTFPPSGVAPGSRTVFEWVAEQVSSVPHGRQPGNPVKLSELE
jgi:hypothetical protein